MLEEDCISESNGALNVPNLFIEVLFPVDMLTKKFIH